MATNIGDGGDAPISSTSNGTPLKRSSEEFDAVGSSNDIQSAASSNTVGPSPPKRHKPGPASKTGRPPASQTYQKAISSASLADQAGGDSDDELDYLTPSSQDPSAMKLPMAPRPSALLSNSSEPLLTSDSKPEDSKSSTEKLHGESVSSSIRRITLASSSTPTRATSIEISSTTIAEKPERASPDTGASTSDYSRRPFDDNNEIAESSPQPSSSKPSTSTGIARNYDRDTLIEEYIDIVKRNVENEKDREKLVDSFGSLIERIKAVNPKDWNSKYMRGFLEEVVLNLCDCKTSEEVFDLHDDVVRELRILTRLKKQGSGDQFANLDSDGRMKLYKSLVKKIKTLHIEIKRCERAELTNDDMDDEQSPFVLMETFQKDLIKKWRQVMDLLGFDPYTGLNAKRKFKLRNIPGLPLPDVIHRYVELSVEKMLKTKNFPDRSDIIKMITEACKYNEGPPLDYSQKDKIFMAKDILEAIVKENRDREHKDLFESLNCYAESEHLVPAHGELPPSVPPPELEEKFKKHATEAQTNMDELFRKYVKMQDTNPKECAEDEDVGDEDEDGADDEEELENENEGADNESEKAESEIGGDQDNIPPAPASYSENMTLLTLEKDTKNESSVDASKNSRPDEVKVSQVTTSSLSVTKKELDAPESDEDGEAMMDLDNNPSPISVSPPTPPQASQERSKAAASPAISDSDSFSDSDLDDLPPNPFCKSSPLKFSSSKKSSASSSSKVPSKSDSASRSDPLSVRSTPSKPSTEQKRDLEAPQTKPKEPAQEPEIIDLLSDDD